MRFHALDLELLRGVLHRRDTQSSWGELGSVHRPSDHHTLRSDNWAFELISRPEIPGMKIRLKRECLIWPEVFRFGRTYEKHELFETSLLRPTIPNSTEFYFAKYSWLLFWLCYRFSALHRLWVMCTVLVYRPRNDPQAVSYGFFIDAVRSQILPQF